MIDSHTHSKFSHDGKASLEDMAAKAVELGLSYMAVTEHLDRDYKFCGVERFVRQLNLKKYTKAFEKIKGEINQNLALGVECGYSKEAVKIYQRELPVYDFDVIINSVHSLFAKDLYNLSPSKQPDKKTLYKAYLKTVLDSIDCDYDYDIVGHIGYVSRYVNFEDKSLLYSETSELIDEILERIIALDKTLELNTNVKGLSLAFLPEIDILKRYKALGGNNITFSSDAHLPQRICDNYQQTTDIVKKLGFTHYTVYKKRKQVRIEIL